MPGGSTRNEWRLNEKGPDTIEVSGPSVVLGWV